MGNQKRYTTEKSLSDKGCTIVNLNNEDKSVYPEEDVKEFIKALKKGLLPWIRESEVELFIEEIDKLAGDKLTWT